MQTLFLINVVKIDVAMLQALRRNRTSEHVETIELSRGAFLVAVTDDDIMT